MFDSPRMVRERTEQRYRDERDEAALRDASWAPRRLVDRSCISGAGATLYAVCELMDRAALNVGTSGSHVRSCLLSVARNAQNDARLGRERTLRQD